MFSLKQKILLVFIALWGGSGTLMGQSAKRTTMWLESSLFLANENKAPFWLQTNNYGETPETLPSLQLKYSLKTHYDSSRNVLDQLKKFDWAYGATVVNNFSKKNQFLISEAYLKARWKAIEFYVGRRKEIFGFTDTSSTSGSYIWSGNALPIPKIQLHTPGYVPIDKKGVFSFKAGISHGWFGKDSVVSSHLLHQKWLYLKLGKENSKVRFYGGVNHQAMWGGYSEILKDVGGKYPPTINGYLAPYPLYSYQYLLVPFLQKIVPPNGQKVTQNDGGNAVGNQLGSVDFGTEIIINDFKLFVGKQQPYDFGRSIKNLNNIEDGLYTFSLNLPYSKLNKLAFDFFYSKSHGRTKFGKVNASNRGEIDNYFFHGVYQSWSYKNRIIGNPFIIYESENGELTYNNRVKYFSVLFKGDLKFVTYEIRHAYSLNYGIYGKEFFKKQHSSNLLLQKVLNTKWLLQQTISFDSGSLYTSSFGSRTSLRYIFK
ncbi:capsule assembly Wzi family protein [uncultured Arcticibacterium sp.]|uniref:capsule assembly Wzi family protein n=1 Tax=uncultured Arcticibacterium sp. TaxID=2173042 RepID=UPI0030FB6D97